MKDQIGRIKHEYHTYDFRYISNLQWQDGAITENNGGSSD